MSLVPVRLLDALVYFYSDYEKGYKMRTHIAKSLQTRCKAIRRALAEYNAAARELSPPREPLNMDEVSHCGFVEHCALLQDTRNDIRDKPWAKPLYREVLKLRHSIARAKEEIIRCNVETRRLHTSIYDQAALFKTVLRTLKYADNPLYGPVKAFTTRRNRVNSALLKYIQKIHQLRGFTGDRTRGVRVGSGAPIDVDDEDGPAGNTHTSPFAGLVYAEDGDSDDEGENDDEFLAELAGLTNFFQSLEL